MPLGPVQKFAVDADVVFFGIGFAAKFSDDLAIHLDQAARNELFRFASRGNSGCRDDFLKALSGHKGNALAL